MRTLRSGYMLLLSILIIGVVASAIVSSLLLLGTASNRGSFSVQQSAQSLAFVQGCAEIALFKLSENVNYIGSEQYRFPLGMCDILTIGGTPGSNTNRFICVEATTDDVVRKLEIIVSQVKPQARISSWQEVLSFTLCS